MERHRWSAVPRRVRVIVGAAVLVFTYGTMVHLLHLVVGGVDPYPTLPPWLTVYFVSLTALNPLAAGLLALRRAAGLVLGCGILITDATANAYANYLLDPADGITPGRIGQAVITVLAVALVALAPQVRPWLRPDHRASSYR